MYGRTLKQDLHISVLGAGCRILPENASDALSECVILHSEEELLLTLAGHEALHLTLLKYPAQLCARTLQNDLRLSAAPNDLAVQTSVVLALSLRLPRQASSGRKNVSNSAANWLAVYICSLESLMLSSALSITINGTN
jgi:hypothetical protein